LLLQDTCIIDLYISVHHEEKRRICYI